MELAQPRDQRLTSIAFGGNRFLVAGTHGILFSSENGKDWVRIPTRIQDDFEEVFYSRKVGDTGIIHGRFMAIGRSGALYGESEGKIWKQIMPAQEGRFKRFLHWAEGSSLLLLDSGGLLYSNHGADTAADRWTRAWARTKSNLVSGATGAGKWIGVGGQGAIVSISDSLIRRDSLHFTPIDARSRADLHGISWGAGRFVAVGDSGTILSSPDGESWEKEASGTSGNLHGIEFGSNTFVAITDGQLLFRKGEGLSGRDSSGAMGDDAVGAWLAQDQSTFRIGKLDSLRAGACVLSDSIDPPLSNWNLPVPALPAWGGNPGDFVPPGWHIRVQDSGDANGDGHQDIAFVIRGDGPGLALNAGEDNEKRFEILGILFGGNTGHRYRLVKQIDLITDKGPSWQDAHPFACPHGELLLGINGGISIFCGTEYGAGDFWSFEGFFEYQDHGFRLVHSTEYRRNGSLEYASDSLDLVSGRRRCEKGNESENHSRAPEVKEDTVSLPEPITFDNFPETWKGISEFLTPDEMRKREGLFPREGENGP